jgi:hypothetical protein
VGAGTSRPGAPPADHSIVLVDQSGAGGNSSAVSQAGAYSNAWISQVGSGSNSVVFQLGTGGATERNQAFVSQTGNGQNSLVVQAGKANVAFVTQH